MTASSLFWKAIKRQDFISGKDSDRQTACVKSTLTNAIKKISTKQMSVRHRKLSFLLMEEASTIRLLSIYCIPAILRRSYDTATVYVMRDKVKNDIMLGDKVGKAILSNLSYQFFLEK